MKLSSKVMDAVRGIGVAAALVGCGAAQEAELADPKPAEPIEVVVTPPDSGHEASPDAETVPVSWTDYENVPPPCGRG